jgi:hypothetical protein
MYNSHFFGVLKVAVVNSFDFIQNKLLCSLLGFSKGEVPVQPRILGGWDAIPRKF